MQSLHFPSRLPTIKRNLNPTNLIKVVLPISVYQNNLPSVAYFPTDFCLSRPLRVFLESFNMKQLRTKRPVACHFHWRWRLELPLKPTCPPTIDKEKSGRDWKWMQKEYTGYTPQVQHGTLKMMVSKFGISYSRVQFSGEPCQTENMFHRIQVRK